SSAQCDEAYVGDKTDQRGPSDFVRPLFNVVNEFAPVALRASSKSAIFVNSQPTALATRYHVKLPPVQSLPRLSNACAVGMNLQCGFQRSSAELKHREISKNARRQPGRDDNAPNMSTQLP